MRRRGGERQGRPGGPERADGGHLRGRRGTAFGVAVVVGVAALALLLVMCGAGGERVAGAGVPTRWTEGARPNPVEPELRARQAVGAPTDGAMAHRRAGRPETGSTPTPGAHRKEPNPWSRRAEPP
ncbi:hypothetical protein [Streptomyces sp. WZ-12]|uniref:hypothetical protein n=1 Tax=Streptomyces sp. WZ-12 TaxID=3030210 RepID=UPI002380EBAE|nr:hypothetical protein [Streptomyces sp. WZ-12]